ncbi:hypothetical protein [Curtobacterium flaccumfaciens]|uniref:hypothetical protein n=1 Tax=Curtobacterium flaccumfaciens TaxID=2035 RepID=UPI001ADCBE7C|nr:hypothetical protein [Curtobacterium flaccumfaciens]MBO9050952.1 hypothetical protein [Curtobacterium flaccumfaciens pv. flaccumfaciens]
MDIDFTAIGTVAGVGFVAAVGLVLVYTLGLRLLGTGQPDDAGGERTQYSEETPRSGHTPPAALAGAVLCCASRCASPPCWRASGSRSPSSTEDVPSQNTRDGWWYRAYLVRTSDQVRPVPPGTPVPTRYARNRPAPPRLG